MAAPQPAPESGAPPGAAPGSRPVLSLRGATAVLGARTVLRGIDLAVGSGEVVALLGANGSGKSTTIRTVIGQVPLASGELELFGTPFSRFRDWRRIGYVPQRSTAAGGVPATVREVVSSGRLARSGLRPLGRADRAAVARALDVVGLGHRAKDSVNALSGGQHQRVLIARALAAEPDLLIMDEPLAGVDVAAQDVLADALREQVRRGTSVLLVLHEAGPLAPLIDRGVLMRDGLAENVADPERLHDLACHPHDTRDAAPGAAVESGLSVSDTDPGTHP